MTGPKVLLAIAVLWACLPGWGGGPHAPLIAVDVGHTLKAHGATSARGEAEFIFNLRMAKALKRALESRNLRTCLINGEGDISSLGARCRAAEEAGADLLLSVHHDSVQPQFLQEWMNGGRRRRYCDLYEGHSLFVSGLNGEAETSEAVARCMGEELCGAGFVPTLYHAMKIPGESRELLDARLGVYRYDGLAVLRKAKIPAVLLECGMLINRREELALRDPARIAKMASAVAAGVAQAWRGGLFQRPTQGRGKAVPVG